MDVNDNTWGLQTIRLDYSPRDSLLVRSDPRLAFDIAEIDAAPAGCHILPLSLFKKSPIEWGHEQADILKSQWLRPNVDTSHAYSRLLVETSIVLRNMWFAAAWEDSNYFYAKNS